MYVLNATSAYDVDACQNVVEIVVDKWLPGTGWKAHKDFLYTRSNGDWTELKFHRTECVKYASFLDTMVERNLDVCRKIAQVRADQVIDHGSYSDYLKLMNSLEILDPTFEPPRINLKCRWQRELLDTICKEWTKTVISTCYNCVRLGNYEKHVSSFAW